MSDLDDANAALAILTERCAAIAAVITLVGPSSGVDLTAVEALATRMKTQADVIDAAVASAKAAAGEAGA